MKTPEELKGLSDEELDAYRLTLEPQWDAIRAALKAIVAERNARLDQKRAKQLVDGLTPTEKAALLREIAPPSGAQTIQLETLSAVGEAAPLKG